jgi:hypothetical protein
MDRKEFSLAGCIGLEGILKVKNLCLIFRKIKFSIFRKCFLPHPTPTQQERLFDNSTSSFLYPTRKDFRHLYGHLKVMARLAAEKEKTPLASYAVNGF